MISMYHLVSYRIIEYHTVSFFTIDNITLLQIFISNQINNKKKHTKASKTILKADYTFLIKW